MNTRPEGLERLRKDILLDAALDAEARLRVSPNAVSGCEMASVERGLSPEPTAEPGSINTGPALRIGKRGIA